MADSKLLPTGLPEAIIPRSKSNKSKKGSSSTGDKFDGGDKAQREWTEEEMRYGENINTCNVAQRPDGRRCPACWLKDDMLDPVCVCVWL